MICGRKPNTRESGRAEAAGGSRSGAVSAPSVPRLRSRAERCAGAPLPMEGAHERDEFLLVRRGGARRGGGGAYFLQFGLRAARFVRAGEAAGYFAQILRAGRLHTQLQLCEALLQECCSEFVTLRIIRQD